MKRTSARIRLATALPLVACLAGCGLTTEQLGELADGAAPDDTVVVRDDVPPGTDAVTPRDDVAPGTDVPTGTDAPVAPDASVCPPSCDDGNPCTDDGCVGASCTHTNNAAACDDGNACNGADHCGGGACSVHAGAPSCDDGNPCTSDSCTTGACAHAPTSGAACPGGTCMAGTCTMTTTGCGGGTVEAGPPDYSREGTGGAAAGANANQQMALVRANHWRTSAGIAPYNENAQLNASSTNHANFTNTNPQASCWPGAHDENMAGCSGYTGQWPWDRMTAQGYAWTAAAEDMNFVTDPVSAVDGWIWTPYHRHPFLTKAYVDLGYGQAGAHDVMDFGAHAGATASMPAVVIFPVPGQTGVPTSFAGNESPMPPAPTSTHAFPSGPVISVSLNTNGTITEHTIWDASCTTVVNSMSNSDGNGGTDATYWYFYSDRPLSSGQRYTVRVSGTVGTMSFTRTWAFTTM